MGIKASQKEQCTQAETGCITMPSAKKHYFSKPVEQEEDFEKKILTLMQFARKAGKLVHGFEACRKEISHGKIKLVLLTQDISDNTKEKMMRFMEETGKSIPTLEYGTQQEMSAALGLPWTGIIGILDNNFAGKILSYYKQ